MHQRTWQGFTTGLDGEGILVVTLTGSNAVNAMTQGMKRDLAEMLAQAHMADDVRVVLFTGEGNAFCGGDDISGGFHSPDHAPASVPLLPPTDGLSIRRYASLRLVSHALTRAVRDMDKPMIAAINGHAIQSGLTLALGCDYRIAAPGAKLGSATLRFGFLPDEGGHHLLVEYLGAPRALEFLLGNKIVTAIEAERLGLVSEVADDPVAAARDLADRLARQPQVALRLLKRAVWRAQHASLDASLDDIALRAALSDDHPDAHEGVAAFRERRPARFNAWLAGGEPGAEPGAE
ncbi:enoyl-CoA hydratase/isomerase family protein [Dactylosporangium sp. AC04546]|uniref:enoyl-CoA hydratase/isomerase family protein n=1 Tax=Dactylosporangium sp. AC04546 TaxID=2862460 RepID=UPI001EDEED37|nr:enoyl-CoA hydratase/isomerase family protein [Dactylosporangium sp. AC04546]WVK86843.1 enoyl-CoA hydratase/isomerase family protein [Dactylosporangium sp. AC04546]